jgi:hypothetical protein
MGDQAKEPESKPMRYDVFISYSRDDQDVARHLAKELSTHGLRPWIDLDLKQALQRQKPPKWATPSAGGNYASVRSKRLRNRRQPGEARAVHMSGLLTHQ